LKRSLEDFYREWKRELEERKKEANTAKTLIETLSQGIYLQSPHVVFKVIGELRLEYIPDDTKDRLALSIIQVIWQS
jgi:hypothetical protein